MVIRRRDVIHVSDNQLSSSFRFQISRNIMPPKYKIFHNIYCMAGQSKAGGKSQVFRVLTILPTNGKMPFREFAKFVVVSAFSRTSPVTISKFRFFSFTCSIWIWEFECDFLVVGEFKFEFAESGRMWKFLLYIGCWWICRILVLQIPI